MDSRLVRDNAAGAYVPVVPSTASAATQVQYVSGVADSTVVDISPVHSVSFSLAPHPAEPFPDRQLQTSCDEGPALALLRRACTRQHMRCRELLQTSLSESDPSIHDIIPKKNGFVHTVMEAYNRHRALIIRPDDVWLAILIQFSFFVNGNAELLRKKFVSHEGKKELTIITSGNRYSIDFGHLSREMTRVMNENIVDPSLRDWIMPQFSTTTLTDTTTFAMAMMATMKKYFSYGFTTLCGIPRVTIEGEKQDWESILTRLEKLKEFGVKAIAWYHLLRPIITRFIAAYDNPNSNENLEFWSKAAHYKEFSSGSPQLSGWITAFCAFSAQGQWQAGPINENIEQNVEFLRNAHHNPQMLSPAQFAAVYCNTPERFARLAFLALDGFPYPRINADNIPPGYEEIDIKLNDNGELFDTVLVAGSVGCQICSDERSGQAKGRVRDTVRPVTAWWYFIKKAEEQTAKVSPARAFSTESYDSLDSD